MKSIRALTFALLMLPLLLAYQNCTKSRFSGPSSTYQSAAHGGGGYDGKPFYQYGSCPDGSPVTAQITMRSDHAVLVRENCVDQEPVVIAGSEISFAGYALIYSGRRFLPEPQVIQSQICATPFVPDAGASCSLQKGASFAGLLQDLSETSGVPAGSRILGCDARNMGNQQLADVLPTDLSNIDGVVVYNLNGVNPSYTISPTARPGFVVMTLMQNAGGSAFSLSFQNDLSNRLLYSHLSCSSGGASGTVSGLKPGSALNLRLFSSGGSTWSINGLSYSGAGDYQHQSVIP